MSTVTTVLSEKIGYITRNSVGVSDGRKQAGGEQTGRESGERRSKRGSCNCSCVSASISHVSAFKSKSSSLFLGRNLLLLVLSSPSMARLRNKQSVHFCWTCMSLTRILVFLFPLAVSQPPQESSGLSLPRGVAASESFRAAGGSSLTSVSLPPYISIWYPEL